MRKPVDMFNNIIESGDYITYPSRQGSDMYMRTAKVMSVVKRQLDGEKPELVAKIKVAIVPRWPQRKYDLNWEDKIKVVKVTFNKLCRCTVVPKSYIQNDKRYRCLLEE